MPTENRSSNTEMVSVPRERLQAWQQRFSKAQMFQQSTEVQAALTQPAALPHPEPIAWMVDTAFWWTKEEAERDAADTGLPIVGLGPMSCAAPAEQHKGEPVAWLYSRPEGQVEPVVTLNKASAADRGSWDEAPLYAHAHSGEVERLARKAANADLALGAQTRQVHSLRAQLAEQDSLLREVLEAFKLETDGSCINPGRDFIRPWAAKLAALTSSAAPQVTS